MSEPGVMSGPEIRIYYSEMHQELLRENERLRAALLRIARHAGGVRQGAERPALVAWAALARRALRTP